MANTTVVLINGQPVEWLSATLPAETSAVTVLNRPTVVAAPPTQYPPQCPPGFEYSASRQMCVFVRPAAVGPPSVSGAELGLSPQEYQAERNQFQGSLPTIPAVVPSVPRPPGSSAPPNFSDLPAFIDGGLGTVMMRETVASELQPVRFGMLDDVVIGGLRIGANAAGPASLV